MLPEKKEKPKVPLAISDNIIEIHKTKEFSDKHLKPIGADIFGLANISQLEESETPDKIIMKDGVPIGIRRVSKDTPLVYSDWDYASDEDAARDL